MPPLRKSERILLSAGLIPLPWFLAWISIGGALTPGYNALSQQGSELTLLHGLPHVLADVAALGSGISFVAFAVGLWHESGKRLAVGAVAWMFFGLAMTSNGIWAMGSPKHGLYAIGLTFLIAPALSLLEMRRLRDNNLTFAITAFVSFAGVFYLWMNVAGADPRGLQGLTHLFFHQFALAGYDCIPPLATNGKR